MSNQLMFKPEYCREKYGSKICAVRSQCHRRPELGMEEYETTALIKKELKEAGIEILDLGLNTGVVGIIRGADTGKTVALRCDIDALPVTEETGAADKSEKPGLMHACGHDAHITSLLGAALLLKEKEKEFPGNVLLIFQPAEEPISGAKYILEKGLYDKFRVCATFGMHVWPFLKKGEIGVGIGPVLAAKDSFSITIHGKGGHGSSPNRTIDPIAAGAEVISAIYSNLNRNISPFDVASVSICKVESGFCDNVIPDTFTMLGSMRTFTEEVRTTILKRLEEIAKGVAEAYGCSAEYKILPGVPACVNDKTLHNSVLRAAEFTTGTENIIPVDKEVISEDFALYPQPAYHLRLGVGEEGKPAYPLHSSRFYVPGDAIYYGASIFANCAIAVLTQ